MTKTVRVYYDFISPYSFLALSQLTGIGERTGATFDFRPVHVLTLMSMVGNRPTTVECKAKARYAMADLGRWSKRLNVPIVPSPHLGKIDTRPLLLGAIAARESNQIETYNRAIFEGIWQKGAAFESDDALLDMLASYGVKNAAALLADRANLQNAQDALLADAVKDGVFGVPSFVFAGKLFFGNDRLSFLEEALTA
jgi:2-hydroxychromene-2-carboxylate isomerase